MPPPPSRGRFNASRGIPSRAPAREAPRAAARKVAGPSSTAPSPAAVAAASTARDEALREALAKALNHDGTAAAASDSTVDVYGNGSPTDRLQFGYSPAVAAEAVAFHARFTTAAWLADRKRNGRNVFAKKQKLALPNCEPVTSILKLQSHWRQINAFQSDVRGGAGGKLKAEDLDKLVDMLASKQRVDEDEDEV